MVVWESWNLGKQLLKDPVDPLVEVQDETSGCAFDGSYELIYNGRPPSFFSLHSEPRSCCP